MKIDDRLLTLGASHGRSGKKMAPEGVVVHYVGNPGSSALANRNYFENGSDGAGVSSHYIIGLSGEIIRCVPDNECAAHAGVSYGAAWDQMAKTNNSRFIGIECCHPASDGKFSDCTANSLVELTAYLCKTFKLDPDKDVYRHYDAAGKCCPLYYVNNPKAWADLKCRIQTQYKLITQPAPVNSASQAASAPVSQNVPSYWAADAWAWAKKNGLNDGTRPADTITREETASFVFNFFNLFVFQSTSGCNPR